MVSRSWEGVKSHRAPLGWIGECLVSRCLALLLLLLLAGSPPSLGQRISCLLTGQVDPQSNPLLKWFSEEPTVEGLFVPTRPGGLVRTEDIQRFVRIYFPRSYEKVRSHDFLMLHSPVMYHFTNTQVRWMYDSIMEGTGALSAPACMSSSTDIHGAWISSPLSLALPNDCPGVLEAGGPGGREAFRIEVNRDFPEPVLTPFIPLGIEKYRGVHAYMIIPREGATALAWNIGSFVARVPYMASWAYGEARTMTLGDSFGLAFWSSYSGKGTSTNPYGLDILMNMVLYLTGRRVPTEVMVFHRLRGSFVEFRTRIGLLISLMDFAQKFGANDRRLGGLAAELEEGYDQAKALYLEQKFQESEAAMEELMVELEASGKQVRAMKERALLWVYIVEWLVTTATLMISSFIVWTLMVQRRLYRTVRATRLERSDS
jgi:hypothetical protein